MALTVHSVSIYLNTGGALYRAASVLYKLNHANSIHCREA